jgi:proteasome lid subunit RPN8/RPN11
MLTAHMRELRSGFAHPGGHERAAYLFCTKATTPVETRLIVWAVEVVPSEHILSSSPQHVSISSNSYVPALVKADRQDEALVLVHSHPGGYPLFSRQDDREEGELFRTAFIRAPKGPHGSLIVVGTEAPKLIGRVWLDERAHIPISRVRVVGSRLRIFGHMTEGEDVNVPAWADRHVRAFGAETQKLFAKLHVGVVGVGGTGSAVSEQLIRLGIGQLTVIDEQTFTESNVTRVYGSGLSYVGHAKVHITKRSAERIGMGTLVREVWGSVCDQEIAPLLRECDVVFGCTDDYLGRVILNRLAVWYYIPVLDMGVVVDSEGGTIREATGRVTILLPGNACLRSRVSTAPAA